MNEFEIIESYLSVKGAKRKDVLKGIGDDCALLKVPRGQRLAVSMDTLISGVHFLPDSNAADIAHKAVAVNLSDLAAAGAEPAWITLSLSLPEYNEIWLQDFNQGLKRIVEFFGVQLVGGDTCRGPLSITIQAHGFVPENVFLSRDTAQAGELICVTGEIGDAALGLLVAKNELNVPPAMASALLKKYQTPYPKIAAGIAIRGRATSAIDISDGLLADVNHISQQSGVGALLRWERVPLSQAAQSIDDEALRMRAALTGGDDYELCFTVNEDELEATKTALEMVGTDCIPIGRLTGKPGVRMLHHKEEIQLDELGYQHF
ncbi:thiamine-phosphate kinase [Aliikangiella coralliicola]|uniref:Thiamine-monophosphate kinase n=1 Tax=Aliikangiella coralliicola TaxID=2592383 RepID=A0A545U7A5_9GAMM|nr:thiamine-phosphate kinase [Aliikangiella coralliicola]TQV85293.1 thiamine-phosphate kinase [Aliikangiella coralliicola]